MDQMGFLPFLFFLILYILELTTFLIYLVCKNVREKFTFTEANTYILITFMVGEIYNHVIAKNLTRPNHSKLRVPVDSPPKRSSSMHTFPSPLVNTYNESLKISNRRNKKKKKLSTDSLMLESEQNYTNESDLRVRKKFVKKNYKLTDEESNRLTDIGESEGSGNESVSDITHTSLSVSESEQKEPVFSVSDNKNEPEFNNVIIMSNKDHIQEEVMVTFFESTGTRKVKISIWEIFEIIEQRVNHTNVEFNYFYLFLIISIFFSLLPYFFEVFAVLSNSQKNANSFNIINLIYTCYFWFKDNDVIIIIEMFLIVFIRFIMVGCFLFLLFVAEKTYQLRFLYAKFFGALTSSRRAKRNRLPHFRLHKVKNIKAWLSLRSYLRVFILTCIYKSAIWTIEKY
uniref:Putative homeodomain transcription factor 2 (Trinotate prediction) n=1 Tax=Henneguya salminicola TaxID=69463 RepID=A0A6G3ME75_HENSL